MVDFDDVMTRLEAEGTAQNRKIYARHGAAEPMFGVSYAALGKIAKPLGTDQGLAEALWDSGNHDARVLALRVADVAALSRPLVERWLRDVDNYILAEALGGLCARSSQARTLSDAWRDDAAEWPASFAWFIVACTAEMRGVWSSAELAGLVAQIEREVAARPNRVRHEMNGALIAIALRDHDLREAVLAAASRIGRVNVDHGQTGCKTPEIAPYVAKTLAHRTARAARRAAS